MRRKLTVKCVGKEGISEICCVGFLRCVKKSPLGVQKLSMRCEKWLLPMQKCYFSCVLRAL